MSRVAGARIWRGTHYCRDRHEDVARALRSGWRQEVCMTRAVTSPAPNGWRVVECGFSDTVVL